MATKDEFNQACKRILGETMFDNLRDSGFTPHDFCREVAQREFIGQRELNETHDGDVKLVREVARNLWAGEGVTGLEG